MDFTIIGVDGKTNVLKSKWMTFGYIHLFYLGESLLFNGKDTRESGQIDN